MKIRVRQIKRILKDRPGFLTALQEALPHTGLDTTFPGTIQFVFLPKGQMAELNGLHLHHTGATDVITYDLRDDLGPLMPGESPDSRIIAEIYICPDVAAEYAEICGTSQSHELFLYAVHGMLHLAGEDDLDDTSRVSMRAAESRVLKAVAVHYDLNKF